MKRLFQLSLWSIEKLLGPVAIISVAVTVWLGLFVTKPDAVQGELVRMIYVHPAVAWTAYLAFGLCAAASALYLLPRTRHRNWDLLAGASAEVGVVFCALALITGAIWGKPTWGVWWTWDARLTTTAVLLTLFLGYLALRRIAGEEQARCRRNAIAALIAAIDIPIVHMSVEWWRTLHQGRTLARPDPTIGGLQLVTMLLSIVAFTLVFAWLLWRRYQVEQLEAKLEADALNVALAARRNESKLVGAPR